MENVLHLRKHLKYYFTQHKFLTLHFFFQIPYFSSSTRISTIARWLSSNKKIDPEQEREQYRSVF